MVLSFALLIDAGYKAVIGGDWITPLAGLSGMIFLDSYYFLLPVLLLIKYLLAMILIKGGNPQALYSPPADMSITRRERKRKGVKSMDRNKKEPCVGTALKPINPFDRNEFHENKDQDGVVILKQSHRK